jgi:hypothetical protein
VKPLQNALVYARQTLDQVIDPGRTRGFDLQPGEQIAVGNLIDTVMVILPEIDRDAVGFLVSKRCPHSLSGSHWNKSSLGCVLAAIDSTSRPVRRPDD